MNYLAGKETVAKEIEMTGFDQAGLTPFCDGSRVVDPGPQYNVFE